MTYFITNILPSSISVEISSFLKSIMCILALYALVICMQYIPFGGSYPETFKQKMVDIIYEQTVKYCNFANEI